MADRVLWGVKSARSIRGHWALIELGLEYETRAIQTRTPPMEGAEYRAVNPRGKIPTLIDGDIAITESPAIVMYLADRYSTDARRLIPTEAKARAFYFEWMSFISMELDATSLYVLRRHEGLPEIYGEAPEANTAARAYFDRMITAAALRMEDGRPYLLGDTFYGPDILMMTILNWAKRYKCPYPDIFADYQTRIAERPQYLAAEVANNPE
jgi:glutathione S-transferase